MVSRGQPLGSVCDLVYMVAESELEMSRTDLRR